MAKDVTDICLLKKVSENLFILFHEQHSTLLFPYFKLVHLHLADTFIQSELQCIQVIHLLSVCVFSGNWTHDLCAANAMLYHWATGTPLNYR